MGRNSNAPWRRGHCCGDVCEVWEESALSDGGVDCAALLVADGGLDATALLAGVGDGGSAVGDGELAVDLDTHAERKIRHSLHPAKYNPVRSFADEPEANDFGVKKFGAGHFLLHKCVTGGLDVVQTVNCAF